ncbi:hypothetical protein ACJA29_00260 [Metamycoplasma sualvi]|uniref:hypothetical protein n=1 Tax=Metamycoplasma sualvi TaxID=2125 RepID=UPI0038731B74
MSKDKETTQNNEELVIVNNSDLVPEGPIQMEDVIEEKKMRDNIQKAETMMVDVDLVKNNSNVSFQSKSQQEGKKFSGTLSYEDVLSQTQELVDIKNSDIDYVNQESKLRKEKIEGLTEHFNDLNAKPLSSIDSYDNYNLVLNKSIWNYNEIEQRNTKLQIMDLALQTQLYLYDGEVIELNEVKELIENFIETVKDDIVAGYPVILNSVLIVDIIRFDKSKIIPITIANPALIPPIGVVEWQSIVKNVGRNHLVIEAFIKLLDNALSNGHECEFFPGTVMVRNASGITSLYISEAAAVRFNSSISPISPKNKE